MTIEQFFGLILSLILSLLIARLGKNRNIGYGWSFVLCFFLSPIIGVIFILCSKRKGKEFIDVSKQETEE